MALSLVKLSNGTELLGDVDAQTEELKRKGLVRIVDPLQINYKFVSFQPMPTMSISRYMPFASQTTFTFDIGDITHIVEPRASVVEYYLYALDNYRTTIDQHIDDELHSISSRKSKQPLDDDAYSDILERIEVNGPLN
jgi:hypothetical protein